MNTSQPPDASQKLNLTLAAWLGMLAVSDAQDILFQTFTGAVPPWVFYSKLGAAAVFLGICWFWKTLRPLKPYAGLLAILFTALTLSDVLRVQPWWAGLVSPDEKNFGLANMRPYLRDTLVSLAVLAGLFLIFRRRSAFFLVRGQTSAPIEPVRWLGIKEGESWRMFGWIFAVSAAVLVAVPTFLSLNLSSEVVGRALPLLPFALLFAAVNAFNEELYFRSTLLATLPGVIGRNQALLVNAAFFGLSHFLYGSPNGLLGFLMTGFLGWLMGKAMLETKGFFWPWLIHLLPDVVIFVSYIVVFVQS